MRTTNQKSCSHGFYILQIFLRNPRGRSDPPQAENPVKQDTFLKSYYAPFSLYNLNTREHILTLSFYHKRYNDGKIKRS